MVERKTGFTVSWQSLSPVLGIFRVKPAAGHRFPEYEAGQYIALRREDCALTRKVTGADGRVRFVPDLDAIPAAAAERAKLMYLNYPNNPTGAVAPEGFFDRVVEFVNSYREEPKAVSERVFLSCGVYESLIYENRSMVPLLAATGMEVRFVESRDGHNWENWRDRLREGLSWLFPGPLSFIYE